MKVDVELHSFFAQWVGSEHLTLEFSEGPVTMRRVMSELTRRGGEEFARYAYDPEAGVRSSCVMILDGRNADLVGGLDSPVADGATVQLIPPLSGG